jgi:PIN domain nuclease of toxin-antitoxin system
LPDGRAFLAARDPDAAIRGGHADQSASTAKRRGELLSAVSLLELAALLGEGSSRSDPHDLDLVDDPDGHPEIMILPITPAIAWHVAAIGKSLPDLADRAIIATAPVHRLKLIPSDQRIIAARLVLVID